MSPRRTLTSLGPILGLTAVATVLGCGCVSWSIDLPEATAFISRGLTHDYGLALSASRSVKLSLLPLPTLSLRDIRINADDRERTVLAEGGRLAVQLDLPALMLGQTRIVALSLDGAHVALPTVGDGDRTGPMDRVVERLADARGHHPRRLTLRNVTINGGDRSFQALDLKVSWPSWSDRLALEGDVRWRGTAARVTLSEFRPRDFAGGVASPYGASLTWPGGSLTAAGTVTSVDGLSASGQAVLQTASLPETLGWIGYGAALSPLIEALALEGTFEVDRRGLRFPQVRLTAGGTTLDGAASIEAPGERPSIRATLATDALNLGPFVAAALRVTGLDGAQEGWGRQSLALAPFMDGDLDLRLSGSSARIGPVLLDDVAASVIVREDSILASLARANLQGGTLKGHVLLSAPRGTHADETELKAQGTFAGLDLGALLVDAGESGWMLGTTRGNFALEGKGCDAQSIVGRLAGRANIAVDGGAIAGLDLVDVVHRRGVVASGALARRNSRTAFERSAVSLTFVNGIGTVTEGLLSARHLSANLRGRISLPDRAFHAKVDLQPRSSTATAPAVQFEIAGPWDALQVRGLSRDAGVADAARSMPAEPPVSPMGAGPDLP